MPDTPKDDAATEAAGTQSTTPTIQTLPAGSSGPIIITVPQPAQPAPQAVAPSDVLTMEQISEMVRKIVKEDKTPAKDDVTPTPAPTTTPPKDREDTTPAKDDNDNIVVTFTEEDVRKAASARIKLISEVSSFLPDDYDYDSNSDYDIIKESVKDMLEEGEDEPDEVYAKALLKAKLVTTPAGGTSSAEKERRNILASAGFTTETKGDKITVARDTYSEWLSNRWKETT